MKRLAAALLFAAVILAQKPANTVDEQPIADQIRTLRQLPDDARSRVTRDLALRIRKLAVTPNRLLLASGLANLSTEGDFGSDVLQEVANTLEQAVRDEKGPHEAYYMQLAQLVRYERVALSLDDPAYTKAIARLEADDQARAGADFTLTDLSGKQHTLSGLRGKVVLVNFWATWCPPCRKEMPDLQALYDRFKGQGLVILAISDEDAAKVRPFLASKNITYPILLDPGRKVSEQFRLDGIPKSFLYDREGKLVAQAIDMRTRGQFLEMLKLAALK